jgi:hypothetical protein
VRRDVRRFLIHQWRMLEVSNGNPVNLNRVWRARLGYLPPFAEGAVAGWSFALNEQERGVVIARPSRLQLADAVRAQMFTVIASKHGVESVRLGRHEERPRLRTPSRLPRASDEEAVEEFPTHRALAEPVVLAYLGGSAYVSEFANPWHAAAVVEDALSFADADEAEAFLGGKPLRRLVTLKYVCVAQAEADQREAALLEERPNT